MSPRLHAVRPTGKSGVNVFGAFDFRSSFRRLRAIWMGAFIALLACPHPAQAQVTTPLHRVRGMGLDTAVVGRVTTFYAEEDSAHARGLAEATEAAADYFESEFQGRFPLYLAVLGPDEWFDPYEDEAPYGMPWGWIPESLMGVPASQREGILILGHDRDADARRVRFVMLHEYGHLAAKKYLHPRGVQPYSSVRWFEEMVATYFAYAFVYQHDAEWARAARREWVGFVGADAPPSATLDWSFMFRLPPQEFGQTYAWYQNLLNVRAADLYAEHGLAFLRHVRDGLPWDSSQEWTTEEILPLLDSFAPGFRTWAEDLQQGRYLTRPPV